MVQTLPCPLVTTVELFAFPVATSELGEPPLALIEVVLPRHHRVIADVASLG